MYIISIIYFFGLLISFTNASLNLKSSNTFAEINVGLENINGAVVAFGDFNSDKFTDLFILNSDLNVLSLYIWNIETYSYTHLEGADINISNEKLYILNVIPGDFNYDGKLDVLIMACKELSKDEDDELIMRLYIGKDNSFEEKYIDLPSSINIQPTVIDYYGNMYMNLLGYPYEDPSELYIWKYNNTGNYDLEKIYIEDKEQNKRLCRISNPHSNAFIDLDGDCLSDLFVTCRDNTYEIWKNTKDKGFVFSRSGDLPSNAGQITFSDMDADGTLDMVFTECDESGKDCSLHIVYNKQKPLCSKLITKDCRSVHELCSEDNNYSFDFDLNGDGHVQIKVKNTIRNDSFYNDAIPIPIRIGDINMDGYPDVALPVFQDFNHIELMESVQCTKNYGCSENAIKAKRRTFKYSDHSNDIKRYNNIRSAAFIDIEENGTVDLLLFGDNDKGKRIYSVVNSLHNDAFFMKTLALNGACLSTCTDSKYPPFGVNYPGGTFKFTVIDLLGQKRANQVAQLPQSNYNSLQTPYCLFGLGRTNSYIEELFVGVSRRSEKHYTVYSGMIPNSQLIIIPYQQENSDDTSSWQLKQFINPSEYVPYVFISLVCTIVLLALITLGLQLLEKREDELEKKRALHIINFDAF